MPGGWEAGAIAVPGRGARPAIGWCLEAHDLAASKLAALREKDWEFLRVLLVEDLISPEILRERASDLRIEEKLRERILRWVEMTAEVRPRPPSRDHDE